MKPMRILSILCPVLLCAVACGAPQASSVKTPPEHEKIAAAQESPQVEAGPGPFDECLSDVLGCAIFTLDFMPDYHPRERDEALKLILKAYVEVGMVQDSQPM